MLWLLNLRAKLQKPCRSGGPSILGKQGEACKLLLRGGWDGAKASGSEQHRLWEDDLQGQSTIAKVRSHIAEGCLRGRHVPKFFWMVMWGLLVSGAHLGYMTAAGLFQNSY
jgi:predicted RNA binding protein YcfA (HicA-like mRNA interferase family)